MALFFVVCNRQRYSGFVGNIFWNIPYKNKITMELDRDSKLLRIFIGEFDKLHHTPLYQAILNAARKKGLAGCTVIRGIMSFGASSIVHTAKFIEISPDLPSIIE